MHLISVALDKIQAEFTKESIKTSDNSSNDESDWISDDKQAKRTGARKKKQNFNSILSQNTHKKDQLIQTIYTGSYNGIDV